MPTILECNNCGKQQRLLPEGALRASVVPFVNTVARYRLMKGRDGLNQEVRLAEADLCGECVDIIRDTMGHFKDDIPPAEKTNAIDLEAPDDRQN